MIDPYDLALLRAYKTYHSNGRPVDRDRETSDAYQADRSTKKTPAFIFWVRKFVRRRTTKQAGPLRQQRPPRDDEVGANITRDATVSFSMAQDRAA